MQNLNNISLELKSDLNNHIIETISDCFSDKETDFDNLHHRAFNDGYYKAGQWLKSHDIDPFDAINFINEYNINELGTSYFNKDKQVNSKTVTSRLAYILGEDLVIVQ